LQTKIDGKMATKYDVKTNCNLLYNLWMDLPLGQRYSYIYHGEKDTIDNIFLLMFLSPRIFLKTDW